MSKLARLSQTSLSSLISSNSQTPLTPLAVLRVFLLALLFVPIANLLAQTPTPVPVTTWRYDLTHAGQNTQETALTLANVNVNSFGKLFALSVDSTVYSQPLYMPGLKMSDGLVHNVLFVATENDSIYAFDADSNGGANANPIWKVSLLTAAYGAGAGATAVPWADTGSPDVAPTVGITGTGTINPATNTMYVLAHTTENGVYFSRLHAINIITGAEEPNSPVNITATVAGTGNGSSGGQLSFSPLFENQRTALNYYNGFVYFGYGAHGDNGPWHGWLFSYDASTLQQKAVLCLTPNGIGAGLWASGAGMPIDEAVPGGRMFVVTGNGTHSSFPPFSATSEMGESVVAFNLTNGGLTPVDGFTSYNFQTQNNADWDQGAGGVLMVPNNSGPNPHMLITGGKEGRVTVLNRDNLGGFLSGASANTNALQDITGLVPVAKGFWSTPAYWNGNVYIWAEKNVPMLLKLTNGVLSTTPDSKSPISTVYPDPSFSISSNGTQDGIAWAVKTDLFNSYGPGVLYAWNANDLTNTIYESDTNSKRDAGGPGNRFSIPMVTNGKVYVVANGQVDVYGLFNGVPNAAAPVITPNGGTFATSQNVQLSSATASASIYYTLDGTTPTPSSTLYTAPITISTNTTIKAIANASGFVQSGVTTATFTFTTQTPTVTFSPAGGTYNAAQTVTLADADANAKIYYTTDGSTPSASSTLYAGPILVAVSETINAIAIDPALQNSNVSTAAYVIQNGGMSINFATGFASTTGLTLNGSAAASNDTRLQLTSGGLNQAGSVFWNTPISIQAFTTTFEFQLSNAQGNGFTFTVQNVAPTALGGNSAGLGYQGIPKSVAIKFNFYDFNGEGNNSTGVYTNGQAPTLPTVDITPSGIVLSSGDSIQAQIDYDGTTLTLNLLDLVTNKKFTMSQVINIPATIGGTTAYVGFTGGTGGLSSSQKILTWTYQTQSTVPIFAPAAGTYATAQNVALSTATADAAIYYTVDGSTPNAASTKYASPIAVAASETIKAIAISPTFGSSDVVSAAYVIQNSQPAATFSLTSSQAADVAQGGSTTSTITVAPANGFTGAVTLACVVTAGPAGAVDTPTCSVTQPAAITGTQSVTATLTIATKATTTAGSYTTTVTGTSGTVTASTNVAATVTGTIATPLFALTGAAISITSPGGNGSSVITITPSGGFTGNVVLTCAVSGGPAVATDAPSCAMTQPAKITGTQPATAQLSITTQATTATGSYTVKVSGTSGTLTETTNVALTVGGTTVTSAFSLSATPISITSAGAKATSTITVTPSGGFTGTVTLACALTSSPAAAVDPPTCTVTQPAAISSTQVVTGTVTIGTTGASLAVNRNSTQRTIGLGGGGVLAAVLIFCLPFRRRKWQTVIGMLLFAIVVATATGCGGGTKLTRQGSTTSGSYTVTVTGTSGTQQANTKISVTVP